MTYVVMPEDVWFKLCKKICKARRKQYGYKLRDCQEENECGICPECASDAIEEAPAQYRTTKERAESYDRLPGGLRG
jgi:hypothetical protein